MLTEYPFDVAGAIDEYSRTGLILSSGLKIDARTEKIGLIKGSPRIYEVIDVEIRRSVWDTEPFA